MKIIQNNNIPQEYFDTIEFDDLPIVKEILDDIKINGDDAIRRYMIKFDEVNLDNYQITLDMIDEAYNIVDKTKIDALKAAANNIERFAKLQYSMFQNMESVENGYIYGHKIIPIQKIGCYVPGGRYPLPSSALMTVIPAKVAGVKEIVVCSPKISPETIVAADLAGADQIYQIGGAQAIGAMAFGTESVPKVDKIVGPGNKFVTAAKKRVYGLVGIDFIAGPSEILVIADETSDAEIVAADLLAQAEHDSLARADLVTTSEVFAKEVLSEIKQQLTTLKTKDIASKAIENSYIVIVPNWYEAANIVNQRAPEHLEIMIETPQVIIDLIHNYGSLFLGPYSAEVFGDYCSGPNHTLPTNRVAKYSGGLSVKEYLKVVTYQKIEKKAMEPLIKISSIMAQMEGLHAHQRAAELRKKLL